MNGSCAGGTGAFIDQMATLLDTDAAGLNDMESITRTCIRSPRVVACSPKPICSRSSTMARPSPIWPHPSSRQWPRRPSQVWLPDARFTAPSSSWAVRCSSCPSCDEAFQRALEGKVDEFIVPTDAHLYVAYGSALQADVDSDDQGNYFEAHTCDDILKRLDELKNLPSNTPTMPPLFPTEADREAFNNRHHREHMHIGTLEGAQGPHFLGIDAGSTTIKATLVNDDREIVWSSLRHQRRQPVDGRRQHRQEDPKSSCPKAHGSHDPAPPATAKASSPPACTWTRAWWRPWRTIVVPKWFNPASPPSSTSAART